MKTTKKLFKKLCAAVCFVTAAVLITANPVKADEVMQQPAITYEQALAYQQALEAQQALAYQQALEMQQAVAAQQALALKQAQEALALQQQQAIADQYAKALLVYNEAQLNQQRALQHAYMLNSIQNMQKAGYQNMLNTNPNLDYTKHLMEEFSKYQNLGINAFNGYEGLK